MFSKRSCWRALLLTLGVSSAIVIVGSCANAQQTQHFLSAEQTNQSSSASKVSAFHHMAPNDFEQLRHFIDEQQSQLRQQSSRIRSLELQLDDRRLPSGADRGGSQHGGEAGLTPTNYKRTIASECGECDLGLGSLSGAACDYGDCSPIYSLGGQYRMMFNTANFDFHEPTIDDNQPSQSFFNERLRTWLTIRTSENVEGYIETEVGHIVWGENFEFPKTYVGPRFPAADDRVGIELRRGYLTYTSDGGDRWRVGIQDWQDSFDQTLASSDWDFNVGGLSLLTTLGSMRLLAGAFALQEGASGQADDAILWSIDGDWRSDDDNSFGWSVYAVSDHGQYSYPTAAAYDSSWDVWIGLRSTVHIACTPLHTFFIYNTGKRNELGGPPDFEHNGFAVKLETGPLPLRFGQLRFQVLYSTGEDDPNDLSSGEFRTVAQSVRDNFGAQGYWSYLALTGPHGPSDVNDLGVGLQNRGLGLFTPQAIYEYEINDCLTGTFSAGWLNSDQPNPTSGSREMGTELMKMFTYDFGGGLKADVGAAVLFTGNFYKPSPAAADPDTLWEVFSRVQLEF